ncbi:MAG: YjfB family protein [bacterium]
MVDSISNASVNMNQAQLMQQVQVSLLDKSLETAETQGEEMVNLIEESGQAAEQASQNTAQQASPITDPAVGQNIDILA